MLPLLIEDAEDDADGLDWVADDGLLWSCAADWLELVGVLWLEAELCADGVASVLWAKTGSATKPTVSTPSTRGSFIRLIPKPP
jgi:hypothetical protein